jgi:hypothetical protein
VLKKIVTLFVLSCAITAVSAHPSHGEIRAGTMEIGLSVGRIFYDSDMNDSDSFFGRIDLGYNLTRNVGIDLSLMDSIQSPSSVPDSTFYTIGAALKMFPDSKINPYFILGAGAGTFNINNSSNSKFVVDGGLGLYYSLSEDLFLKLDARDYMTVNDITHNYTMSVGIVFAFDAFAPSPAPPVEVPDQYSKPSREPSPEIREQETGEEADVPQGTEGTEKPSDGPSPVEKPGGSPSNE